MKSSTRTFALLFLCTIFLPLSPAYSDSGSAEVNAEAKQDVEAEVKARNAERQQLLAEAEAIREEAQRSAEEARLVLDAENHSVQTEEMDRMREELSRVHRQLRDVSRQVAQAHRELEQAEHIRAHGPDERATLGVLLGNDGADGLHIVGVSPDGPAERAGLRQGDVLVSLAGVELDAQAGGRVTLFEVMEGVNPGDEVAVGVLRDGKKMDFKVVAARSESRAWQTILRLPEAPAEPGAPNVIIEKIEIPEIDEAGLASRIEEINRQLRNFEYRFAGEHGKPVDFTHEVIIDGDSFSHIGEQAMRDADFWFGLPQARGLELAKLNPELGKYFKAERGVLVIQARADNAYGLESGDVIQSVDSVAVTAPSDLLRVLRDAEPGADIELKIKRDRRGQKLHAKVPENRLGLIHLHHPNSPAAPAAPAAVD